MEIPHYKLLRVWMHEQGVYWRHIGKLIGVSAQGALMAMKKPYIYRKHRDKMLKFGVPENCLPLEREKKPKVEKKKKEKKDDSMILKKIEEVHTHFSNK